MATVVGQDKGQGTFVALIPTGRNPAKLGQDAKELSATGFEIAPHKATFVFATKLGVDARELT